MKFWPFGEDRDEGEDPDAGKDLLHYNDDEIVVVASDGLTDFDLLEHKSYNNAAVSDYSFLDAIIPAIGAAVDAGAQYGQAIVRFPKGASWADLLNRKTPGLEDFKTLSILKDNKFQSQAAIKQAKLQPAAVGNLALQGAAMVVGQMYMVEINKQLEDVAGGIAAIQEEMRLERESKIEACMELLKEYTENYMTISDDSVEHQAVRNQIEAIRKEAREAWLFQVKQLQDMDRSLRKSGKLKDEELKSKMCEFAQRDKAARDAFIFLMAAEQTKMQYSQSYTESQIRKEAESINQKLSEFTDLRNGIQDQLIDKIGKLSGKPLAIPAAEPATGASLNPLVKLGQTIGRNAPRVFVTNMRGEAKRQRREKRSSYEEYVKRDNPIEDVAGNRLNNLSDLNFIYNQADALLIDERGIHYIRGNDQSDSSDEK